MEMNLAASFAEEAALLENDMLKILQRTPVHFSSRSMMPRCTAARLLLLVMRLHPSGFFQGLGS